MVAKMNEDLTGVAGPGPERKGVLLRPGGVDVDPLVIGRAIIGVLAANVGTGPYKYGGTPVEGPCMESPEIAPGSILGT
jgi:hypothetical protein